MHTDQKEFYPKTYKVIKDLVDINVTSFESCTQKVKDRVIGSFLSDNLLSTGPDMADNALKILFKDKINNIFDKFFNSKIDSEFKEKLFNVVYEEFHLIIDELFDEAVESIKPPHAEEDVYSYHGVNRSDFI